MKLGDASTYAAVAGRDKSTSRRARMKGNSKQATSGAREKNKESCSARDLFKLSLKTLGEDLTRALLADLIAPEKRGDKEHAIIRQYRLENVLLELIMYKAELLLVLAALDSKNPAPLAKWAASHFKRTGRLKSCLSLIVLALHKNDKQFFIDFGKCLAGEMSNELFSKKERDVAEIVIQLAENPGMPIRAGVRELHNRGHTRMTEANLRNQKMRLLKAAPKFNELSRRLALPCQLPDAMGDVTAA
jgi:hypothetical protein